MRYTATLALLIALSTPAFAQEPPPPPHARPATITLSGEGSVFAEPDMATLSAGVVTQADTARAALDANNEAVTSGGNQIDGLSFGISKEDTLTDEARKKAVADARHKAELYAEAAGVKLGKVRRIIEGPVAQPPRAMMMRAMAAKEDSSVPVARGEQEISARVTMTWDLP